MESEHLAWQIENRIQPGAPEKKITGTWNTILSMFFPPTQGYMSNFNRTRADGPLDVFIEHIETHAPQPRPFKFLYVQCTASGNEDIDEVWEEKLLILSDQLRQFNSKRVFGAIAVGRAVKFYEWNSEMGKAVSLEQNPSPLFIDRHCQTVARHLEYIRNHHF
ncbi:hypothetical protein ASPWEDRAFT_179500 [Aspergillus wentii DTO 134E9]|uniref:Uncharacterized protein n=1 Tax=Aspergillus wentii DTO 134E9 TaxID=1073089 RepID=A0A1L9S3T0_ASPWE|nr:uncharacterized protein ASPWEDRAFT_179500 [Aspergillus wentii DTO 134E9]OJJ41803.1 hypothetical protein ASPWEDRAFT_179500 [Aspergillus wentii DTO 134E9]